MQYLDKIKNSKETKNLLSNFFSLSVLQVASYVFPLITLPYLAKVIGVEKFGEIAFSSAVMIYFQTLVDYGFIFSAVRDIARCKDNKQAVSEIYSRVMWARFLLMVVAFIILVILIILVPKFYEMRLILLLSFLLVPGHAMFPEWLFQALEKMKYITIFNVLVKLFFTISIFLFVKEKSDYILQPVFTALGFIVSGILSMLIIYKWGIRLQKTSWKIIWQAIKSNTDLFINQLVPNLYNSLSVLLLGFYHGSIANGIFDAGNKFNSIVSSFISIVSRTFFPFLARKKEKHYIIVRINMIVSISIACLLCVFSSSLISLFFSEEYNSAIIVLRITAISLIGLALSNVYGTNYLIVNGYEKDVRNITIFSSLVGFVFALPLVCYFSYIGAAITITLSRSLMGVLSYIKVFNIKRNEIN